MVTERVTRRPSLRRPSSIARHFAHAQRVGARVARASASAVWARAAHRRSRCVAARRDLSSSHPRPRRDASHTRWQRAASMTSLSWPSEAARCVARPAQSRAIARCHGIGGGVACATCKSAMQMMLNSGQRRNARGTEPAADDVQRFWLALRRRRLCRRVTRSATIKPGLHATPSLDRPLQRAARPWLFQCRLVAPASRLG
jgi:hypothetical protein